MCLKGTNLYVPGRDATDHEQFPEDCGGTDWPM